MLVRKKKQYCQMETSIFCSNLTSRKIEVVCIKKFRVVGLKFSSQSLGKLN